MPPPGYEPFLAAICANPDDDTPRLVYADWLDEHGDPDRAEFIRLSIDASRGDAPTPGQEPHRRTLRELFQRYEGVWKKELPGRAEWFWEDGFGLYSWSRGFPDTVTIVGSDYLFLRHAEEIVRTTPARSIILAVFHSTMEGLAGCPHLLRFRSLFTARTSLGDGGVEQLANSPYFGNMEEVALGGNQMGDAGGLALARSPYLTKIQSLKLSGTAFSPAVQRALVDRFGSRVHLSPPTSTSNAADW